MGTKEFIESFSEKTILGKVQDDILNHKRKHRGKRPKEVKFSSKGLYDLKNCNFFNQDGGYTYTKFQEEGYFQIIGVKCTFDKEQEEDYKVIPDEWNDNGIEVLINKPD